MVINKDTLKLYAVFFHLKYTQRSVFKAIIKQTIQYINLGHQYLKKTYLR